MITPIGVIHTSYTALEKVPIQPCYSSGVGEIELFKEYEEGLKDLEGFSHIMILYLFHKSEGHSLTVKRFLIRTSTGFSQLGIRIDPTQSACPWSDSSREREESYKCKTSTFWMEPHS
jgi:hypothetical protein